MGSEGAPQLSYQFLGRVASYSLVKQAYDKATSYYTGAKSHALVKSGLEFAEQGLVKVGNAPVVTSLGQYCQPLLSKADHFACQQLDKLDNNVIKPCEDISVAKVQAKGKQLVNDKLVDPVAATYSHVKILPLVLTNRALDFAESFVDYLVPEPELLSGEAHEEEREAKEEAEGPTRSQDTLVVPSFGLVRTRATKISVTVARRTRRRVVTRYTAAKTSARAQFARLQAQATQLLAGVLTYLNQYRQKPADVLRAVKLKFKRAPELAQYWTLEVQKWVQAKTGVSTTTVTNYIAHASETLFQLLNNLRQIVLARANKVTEKVKKQTKRTAQATKENEEQEDVLIPATGQSAATMNKQQQQEQEAVDDDGDESDDSEEESDAKETEDDKAKH